MHLSECIASSSKFRFQQCIRMWLFRRTTEFHGSDNTTAMNLPWHFGALCLSYTVGGCAMFVVKPRWTIRSNYPYICFALFLTFVQGPLSYLADYKNISEDSIFHVVDRFAAIASLSMELWKIFVMLFYSRKAVFYGQLLSIIFACSAFIQGQNAQLDLNIHGFIFWHNLWHVYPLLCIVIQFYDFFILGEYEPGLSEKSWCFLNLSLIRSRSGYFQQTLVHEFLAGMQSERAFSSPISDKKSR